MKRNLLNCWAVSMQRWFKDDWTLGIGASICLWQSLTMLVLSGTHVSRHLKHLVMLACTWTSLEDEEVPSHCSSQCLQVPCVHWPPGVYEGYITHAGWFVLWPLCCHCIKTLKYSIKPVYYCKKHLIGTLMLYLVAAHSKL